MTDRLEVRLGWAVSGPEADPVHPVHLMQSQSDPEAVNSPRGRTSSGLPRGLQCIGTTGFEPSVHVAFQKAHGIRPEPDRFRKDAVSCPAPERCWAYPKPVADFGLS